ncbi:MAG: ATP-binding protein [Thermodesulfovibrionales bacterium]|nr:ATP-binding protein [Thermodesulfovibrionales bacterium]
MQIYYLKFSYIDPATRLLIIGILTFNITALLTLIFLVLKNLFKLYIERRKKIPGYRFKSRLVTIFMILILIPSSLLFIGAVSLSTDYINRFFSFPFKDSISNSVELTRLFYDIQRKRVLEHARQFAKGNNLSSDEIYTKTLYNLPQNANYLLRDAFNGVEGTEIFSSHEGDIVRAVVPVINNGQQKAVVIAELKLPKEVSLRAEKLRAFQEEFIKLESFKVPLKVNYIIVLGFLTLIIIFSGLWISLKISQGITEPIQELVIATKKVASGDMDVSVKAKTDDEVGLLISSFNEMVKDIKENKSAIERAYTELDKRRFFLETILENINSGVVFLDNNFNIITINRAACSILDISQEDLIGKSYERLIERFNSPDLVTFVESLKNSKINNVKREIKLQIGKTKKILSVYITGIREPNSKKSLGLLVVFNDLTAIIEAQKLVAKGELARNLAHEIKNPLTPIKLSTERLIKKWKEKSDDFDVSFQKLTNSIISEVESLALLAEEFAKYGRMPEIKKKPENIKELSQDVVNLFGGVKDIKIILSADDELPLINIDKEQIRRAMINIIDNAVKACGENGTIKISLLSEDNYIKIEIADNGVGIKDEEKKELFQPYFSRRKGGLGLGLAITAKIITDHDGQIFVKDNFPQGTIFIIKLPII